MLRNLFAVLSIAAAASVAGSAEARIDAEARGRDGAPPGFSALAATLAASPPLSGMRRDGGDVTVAALGAAIYPAELLPGRYGHVRIEDGAEVVLSSGAYAIESLSVGAGAVVWFDPFDATGDKAVEVVSVRVSRRLAVGTAAEFALIDPQMATTRDVEITVMQTRRLTIPPQAVVRGTLLAPKAKVRFREGSRLEGAVYAHRVHVDRGVVVRYHPRPEDD